MYYVEDLNQAARFYQEILGLKCGWTDTDAQMIGLLFPENSSEIVLHRDNSIPSPYIAYQVENVEKFCQYYKKKGYQVESEPIEVRCGKLAILIDPYGNQIPIIDLTKFNGIPRYD